MPALIRLAALADTPAANHIQKTTLPQDHAYSYAQNIGVPTCLNLVAEIDGQVVGYASVLLTRRNPDGKQLWERVAPYFAFLGVLPERQRHCIGSQLVDEAVRQTIARCPNELFMYLEHEPDNLAAHTLYERKGFRTLSDEEILAATGLQNRRWPVMRLQLTFSNE